MNKIENSILAIQQYCPANGVYLQVVGQGCDQRLEAVKKNWFGRLLMWLGCSNASMIKVAKFLEQNMLALSGSGRVNVHDEHNPLGKLVARVNRFHHKHPSKIAHLIGKIGSAYTLARNLNSQNAFPGIPTTHSKTLSTQLPTATPTVLTKPNDRVQESVDRFKTVRGHVGKVADYILKKSPHNGDIFTDLSKAEEEMNNVKQLLKDSLQDVQRFIAVLKEMTPDEVGIYVAFGLFIPQNGDQSRVKHDIFEIQPLRKFSQSPMFSLAVAHMSVEQLKSFLRSIFEFGNIFLVSTKVFYDFVDLIHRLRSPAEQEILFEEIVKHSCYQGSIFFLTLLIWKSQKSGKQIEIDTLLAQHYMRYLLKNKGSSPYPQLISSFLRTAHFDNRGIAPNSPLQNKAFLMKLSMQEQDDLTVAIVNEAWEGAQVADSCLLNDIMLTHPHRAALLFSAIIEHHKGSELYAAMLEKVPRCDQGYVTALLAANDKAQLLKLVKCSKLRVIQSILFDDSTFIANLSEPHLLMLGEAIVKSYDMNEWDQFYLIQKRIMGDPKLAVALYKQCGLIDIPVYCENHLHNRTILKAIVNSMNYGERTMWEATQCFLSLQIMGIRI